MLLGINLVFIVVFEVFIVKNNKFINCIRVMFISLRKLLFFIEFLFLFFVYECLLVKYFKLGYILYILGGWVYLFIIFNI